MSTPNFSPQQMFRSMAETHRPLHAFSGSTPKEVKTWQDAAWPAVKNCLGDWPASVAPAPRLIAQWEADGVTVQRWQIDVVPHLAATVLCLIPGNPDTVGKRPALFCCHGHDHYRLGKEPIMGVRGSPGHCETIDQFHSDYGLSMARNGYVTFSVDWIGFGEHNDAAKPNHLNLGEGRDWCNILYLHATMFGMTSLSINLAQARAVTDFVATLPFVDSSRLGVMGLSGGGTMALWIGLCDLRYRATEIICYSDLWACFGIRDANYCGMQVAPGLFKLVDLPDLQGLLAPRPLLIDIGANDTCFGVDSAMECYRQVKTIYAAAEASERLQLNLFGGGHAWPNQSTDFFARWLT